MLYIGGGACGKLAAALLDSHGYDISKKTKKNYSVITSHRGNVHGGIGLAAISK